VVKPRRKKREALTSEDVEKIRMSFFHFFVNLFQDYEKYLQPGKRTVEGAASCFNF
jgi:hypothetical protein